MTKQAASSSQKSYRVEVLRSGTFVPMQGKAVTFSDDDLKALASSYDGVALPAPIVIGHPQTDDPAFGWASNFAFEDGRLTAELTQVVPEFADAVRDGRYKKISLALFSPDAPNNPKPGAWYPKHIGFLGATAPAVSGLQPVSFAANDGALIFEFGEIDDREVVGFMRALRDFFLSKFGMEDADRVMPSWKISFLEEQAAAPEAPEPLFSDHSTPKQVVPMKTPEQVAAEQAFAAREAALNQKAFELNHREHVSFADGLITEGRLLPVLKDKIVAILDQVSATPSQVSFSENGKPVEQAMSDVLKEVLSSNPKIVSFGEIDTGKAPEAVAFAAPQGTTVDPDGLAILAKANALMGQNPNMLFTEAVNLASK